MPIEQDFLPYAVGGSANVLSQAAYAALTTLLQNGLTSGIVPSNELNKIMRQPSIIASVIGQFIVANSGQPAIDDGTTATLLANFTTAINAASKSKIVLTDTGTANAYAAANPVPLTALPTATGFTQTVKIAHLNTGTSTYAPDGLATAPIYSLAGALLQGNELPVNGVATLVSFVDPLLNSGSLCWVLYECVGGAQPVAPATASQHAVQFGQVAGVVGSVRNLVMSVTAASATATLTADEIIVESALGGLRYCLASFNKTINLATTGAGGMDTGTAPVSGYVGIYAIWNPTTSTAALLATNATSAVAPNVYGAGHMPSGYTASALVSVWATNSSSQFVIGDQLDRRIGIADNTVLNTASIVGTPQVLSISGAVPPNAKLTSGNLVVQTSGSTCGLTVFDSDSNIGSQAAIISGTGLRTPFSRVAMVVTPQQIRWSSADTGGTPIFQIIISSYEF